MSLPDILPLTGIPSGSIPPSVIVCGDPDRAKIIAQSFDNFERLSYRREYHTYLGSYLGMPVSVCSHGIGASGAAIAFEEIIAAGGRRIIRTGTCGSLQPGIQSGHLVVATGAVANVGYVEETVPKGYPAVADPELTLALLQEAHRAGVDHTLGIVLTRDNFYAGVDPTGSPDYEMMSRANVVAVEMECAALFVIGSLRLVQTAAILAVDGNVLEGGGELMAEYRPREDSVVSAVEREIEIALKALHKVNNVPG
ncbi:MAG TPA: nucleoside phosphorylase [candidate division Zixibacteria bacterium]|nr:nucleoside phosphorylase [candidate division Zixibacteria bacterium]